MPWVLKTKEVIQMKNMINPEAVLRIRRNQVAMQQETDHILLVQNLHLLGQINRLQCETDHQLLSVLMQVLESLILDHHPDHLHRMAPSHQ